MSIEVRGEAVRFAVLSVRPEDARAAAEFLHERLGWTELPGGNVLARFRDMAAGRRFEDSAKPLPGEPGDTEIPLWVAAAAHVLVVDEPGYTDDREAIATIYGTIGAAAALGRLVISVTSGPLLPTIDKPDRLVTPFLGANNSLRYTVPDAPDLASALHAICRSHPQENSIWSGGPVYTGPGSASAVYLPSGLDVAFVSRPRANPSVTVVTASGTEHVLEPGSWYCESAVTPDALRARVASLTEVPRPPMPPRLLPGIKFDPPPPVVMPDYLRRKPGPG